MKGAIGNAFILNMVITFIIIFYMLLIGSMAFSKAYKTKNFLINSIDLFETQGKKSFGTKYGTNSEEWNNHVNEYLRRIGYNLVTTNTSCPDKSTDKPIEKGYELYRNNRDYDYCIYIREKEHTTGIIKKSYNYMVLVYMKFDFPIIGDFIRVPISGETKTYTSI